MVSANDYQLESDVSVDGESLTGITDMEDIEDLKLIGHAVWYTIGDGFFVPREDLLDKMEELGLPVYVSDVDENYDGEKTYIAPPKVTPKRAFSRTRKYLIDVRNDEMTVGGREIEIEVKKANASAFHILANAYFTVEELQKVNPDKEITDGEWRQKELGVCVYNSEHHALQTRQKIHDDIETARNDPLWPVWERYSMHAQEVFAEMQEQHSGKDIQKMLYKYTHHWTTSVKLRDGGAVYFVPARHNESLEAFKSLIEYINDEHKNHGRDCELHRLKVTNASEEREMVEARARQHLHGEVSSALSSAINAYEEQLEEGEEVLVDDIADNLAGKLAEEAEFADEYNAYLETKMELKPIVEQWMDGRKTGGDREHIIEQALRNAVGEGLSG